jgi:hypothetical protein
MQLRPKNIEWSESETMEYDIFSGHDHEDAIWIDAVDGLAAAADRMNQLAREKPGPYFVFCTNKYKILICIDTSASGENAQESITCTQQMSDKSKN